VTLAPSTKDSGATELTVKIGGVQDRVDVSGTAWERGEQKAGPAPGLVALSGAWTAADTFTLEVVRYRTPFTARYQMKFSDDTLTIETRPNVGPVPPPVVGRRE